MPPRPRIKPISLSRSRLYRRSRRLWMSPRLWRPRLVFWLGALAIGLVSVGFAKAADAAQHLFRSILGEDGAWLPLCLLLTPLGFALSSWLALRFFPGSQGSGIPQAIAARHFHDDADRRPFLSLRLAFGKVLLTILGLGVGASIGREGPTVQVGASLMLQAARIGNMAQARGLILAGSAAGIAAAFNTPLAGIVFAIEEMGRAYEARTNGLVLSAVIVAGLAALGLLGNYTYFGEANAHATTLRDWFAVLVCGVGGGALGAGFSLCALRLTRRIRRFVSPDPLRRTVMLAAACGLGVALIGLLSDGQTFGTGYEQARSAVEGSALSPFFFAEKLLASLFSMISGIPGGIFAPSLSVGAGFGSAVGQLLGMGVGLAAILGMAGYFAGVVQAPMTAFVIILEMTGGNGNVIPLMLSAMLGYGTARVISPEPLYHGLSRLFIADALRRKRAENQYAGDASQIGASNA
ncbi:chloride channel protein [Mesorhizobium sp. RP14(2022)]|uniref:Chloride channel protein n=1 Tax=Mesorhizobium liriopis TaxID=2953882 RepID=A0ABT1CBI7_9HYPH|nr:chloride channel protein [Mesorhizobium liriopis]MCO6052180.1 chloride channel protein [Mesorhizobium liriopis]